MKIIHGRFKVDITREEYEKKALQDIERMMDTPGLIWKIWAFDDEKKEAFGLYYFRDDTLAQLIYDNMDPKTWPKFAHDIELKLYDIQEELCRACKVPL
jgi:hypothetical protein